LKSVRAPLPDSGVKKVFTVYKNAWDQLSEYFSFSFQSILAASSFDCSTEKMIIIARRRTDVP